MNYPYNKVVVAGTFDRLHDGHLQLINTAISLGSRVYCGLTTEKMNKQKTLYQTIQDFQQREAGLKNYLKWVGADKKTSINPLNDIYGPTLEDKSINAVITTKESGSNVDKINNLRVRKNFYPVRKIIVDLLSAQDYKNLSSTRIRLGQINRHGKVFDLMFKRKTLVLPSLQRYHFKKPLGKLIKISSANTYWLSLIVKKQINRKPTPMVILVGDVITQSFVRCQIPFSLSVIDYRTRRRPLPGNYHQSLDNFNPLVIKNANQPGTISHKLIENLERMTTNFIFKKQLGVLQINGEEDLTVLPMVLLAPLESLIFYGQPKKGIVQVRVTEKIKEKTFKLLSKFI